MLFYTGTPLSLYGSGSLTAYGGSLSSETHTAPASASSIIFAIAAPTFSGLDKFLDKL